MSYTDEDSRTKESGNDLDDGDRDRRGDYRSSRRNSTFGRFVDLHLSLLRARLQFEADVLRVAADVFEAVAGPGEGDQSDERRHPDDELGASLRRGRRELDRGLAHLDERLDSVVDALRGR